MGAVVPETFELQDIMDRQVVCVAADAGLASSAGG